MEAARPPRVSVVVPVYNNARTLEPLCARTIAALEPRGERFEILLVDDGSRDDSWAVIRRLAKCDERVRGVRLARNFGQAAALCAGFERMRGAIAVTIDADLENLPEDVPRLLDAIEQGHDLVSGVRAGRRDPLLSRRVPSQLTNRVARWVTGFPLHDVGCGLNALTRRVAELIARSGDLRRFLKPLAASYADSIAEVPVGHATSARRRSGYDFMELLGLAIDLFASFSRKPFQRIGVAGVLLFLAGFAGAVVYLGALVLTGSGLGLRVQALVTLAMIFGLQLAVLGLLGEFLVRVYHAQSRPFFVVRDEQADEG